jgi:hypothetical protein
MTSSPADQTVEHSSARGGGVGIRPCSRIAIAAALFVMAGCGGDDGGGLPPGGTYSCRAGFPAADGGAGSLLLCLEASGGTAQDLANNRQQCTAEGNTFASEPCPRAGLVGGCRETPVGSGAVLTTWYYADSGATAADIQMLCDELASIAPASLNVQFVLP